MRLKPSGGEALPQIHHGIFLAPLLVARRKATLSCFMFHIIYTLLQSNGFLPFYIIAGALHNITSHNTPTAAWLRAELQTSVVVLRFFK